MAPSDGRIQPRLDAIDRGLQLMGGMIDDLADAARVAAGRLSLQLQAVELQQHLPDVLQRCAAILDPTRIVLAVPDDLPHVCAGPARLERIMANLVGNALKFSNVDQPVVISATAGTHEVTIAIRDQGMGISAESLPHLFSRFYRAERAEGVEGIGLGLYVTRMLVEAHGGQVWAESELDKGSTFRFTLPIVGIPAIVGAAHC